MSNSMKTLIVVPTNGYDTDRFRFMTSADFPTGLAYIASALKAAGHEVDGLNPNNDVNYDSPKKMLEEKLTNKLLEKSYDVVCLGGLCIHFDFLDESIKLIRKVSPSSKIVIGGGIVTDDAQFIFETLKPDFAISGQGEETIAELMDVIVNNSTDYTHIPNLAYWENEKACYTPVSFKYANINDRAFPDYSIFDIEDMLKYGGLHNNSLFRYTRSQPRVMSIITAIGCPFKCTFCVHTTIHRYKERSIPKIMEEIKDLYDRYQFNVLNVLDELFAIRKERFHEFCEELIRQRELHGWDFDWFFQTHASANLTLDDLKLLKRAGCYYFSYGIESASPTVLESMKKRTHPSQILNAIDIADQANMGFGGNFIFGDIAETLETANESISFFADNCKDLHINLGVIHPYPGSKLFDDYCEENNFGKKERLAFYQNIDKEYINITSLDDNLWTLICREIFTLGNFRWEKITKALECKEEESSVDTLWAEKVGAKIYKIRTACVHCNHEFELREVIGNNNREATYEAVKANKFIFSKEYIEDENPITNKQAHELMDKFASIDTSHNKGEDFITTGCPNCNKRFNIILDR